MRVTRTNRCVVGTCLFVTTASFGGNSTFEVRTIGVGGGSALGVNATGSHVVGTLFGTGPFRQANGTLTSLQSPTGLAYPAVAWSVSASGSSVVGWGEFSPFHTDAYRWNADGGIIQLAALTDAAAAQARAVSATGAIVAGFSDSPAGYRATRWTAAGQPESLGTLPSGTYSFAYGMSDDGERVVGTADQAGESRSFIWTAATGMQSLGNLPSFASGISADGSAVVGTAGFNGLRAFRWTVAGGFQNLGSLFEGGTSRASAVSGDGSVVIGTADGLGVGHNGISERAFIWTEGGGMVDLAVYLQGRGVDCSEWVFTNVRSISADATTIVGSGQYRGANRAFVITIPTPSCLIAFGLSAGFAMRRRRKPLEDC